MISAQGPPAPPTQGAPEFPTHGPPASRPMATSVRDPSTRSATKGALSSGRRTAPHLLVQATWQGRGPPVSSAPLARPVVEPPNHRLRKSPRRRDRCVHHHPNPDALATTEDTPAPVHPGSPHPRPHPARPPLETASEVARTVPRCAGNSREGTGEHATLRCHAADQGRSVAAPTSCSPRPSKNSPDTPTETFVHPTPATNTVSLRGR